MKNLRRLAAASTTLWTVAALLTRAAHAQKPAEVQPLFINKCAPCHGKAGTPPEMYAKLGVRKLSDADWQKSKSDPELHEVIAKGSKGTAMRAFKELKPAEIDALVKFVRTLSAAAK